MALTGFWLAVATTMAAAGPIGVTDVPTAGEILPPTAVFVGRSAATPPEQAVRMLETVLHDLGRKDGFDPDYGPVNRALLQTLADAIDLVEAGARQRPAGAVRMVVLGRWRLENQDFVRQLATDSGQLRNLSDHPLRYRLAEQALYERIVSAVRRNVAVLRDVAGSWEKATQDVPASGG